MTQIIEYSKHFNKFLIHHFEFECNDKTAIGKFAGNCSLNKFMSLDDWVKIFYDLDDSVQEYVNDPDTKPVSAVRKIGNTNFELNVTWVDTDVAFYSKLLTSIDFTNVLPFVIKLKVNLRSNLDKFILTEPSVVTPIINQTSDKKRTTNKSLKKKSMTNGVSHKTPIKLRECCVRLPLLQFNEYGEVIQREVIRNKRKHSSIENDAIHSMRITPKNPDASIFMCSSSSTPFVREIEAELNKNSVDERNTFGIANRKVAKRVTNRLTTTPRSSNDRKKGSSFNPRIRLLKLPEDVNGLSSPKKSKNKKTDKKIEKSNTNTKTKFKAKTKGDKPKLAKKQRKQKVQSIANESELFEVPEKNAVKNTVKRVNESAKTVKRPPTPKVVDVIDVDEDVNVDVDVDIVKIEEGDLKSLTEEDLWKSFDDHTDVVSNLFHNYLKQTDPAVQKSNDYNNFDIISLLTTEQFSVMIDILFDKLVKIGEFGDICYDTLFLELLVPEWIIAIYMKIYSLDRGSAIERILAQKSNVDQSCEAYTTIVSTKLDDTMNNTRL